MEGGTYLGSEVRVQVQRFSTSKIMFLEVINVLCISQYNNLSHDSNTIEYDDQKHKTNSVEWNIPE